MLGGTTASLQIEEMELYSSTERQQSNHACKGEMEQSSASWEQRSHEGGMRNEKNVLGESS